MSLSFTKRLREGVRGGEITTSWHTPRVKVGNRYAMDDGGHVRVTAIREITMADITPALARKGGFAGVVDLLKTAKHGAGQRVFLVEFVFEERE